MKERILVLGAGGPAGVNFMRSLLLKGDIKIYGTDMNKYHIHFGTPYTKKMFLIERKSVDKINEIIEENDIDFIHAQPDAEVNWLSQNRDKIKAKTFLPRYETIEKCQNKYETAIQWFRDGYDTMPVVIEDPTPDILTAIDHFGSKFWLRANKGAGGRGSTLVKNFSTAKAWIKYWKSRGEKWNFIAQKYLPGRNIAWHSLWKDGELIVSQARERLEYIYPYLAPSGITGTPTVQRTINDSFVNRSAKDAVLCIDKKPNGIFCVDLKENEGGYPQPTEINAGRFFTTSFFFSHAGNFLNIERANMPYMYLLLGLDKEFPKGSAFNILPKDLYWLRHIDCSARMIPYENIEGF